MGGRLGRTVRTLAHVRPGQAAHWGRLRAQRAALSRWPTVSRWLASGGPDPVTAVGWPTGLRPLDATTLDQWPRATWLAAGRITLLGVARDLGEPPDSRQADAPLLWRYHLHYWDWAWGLAAEPDELLARALFARLWRSWQAEAQLGHGAAWLPYPAALRAWSWCGQHAALVTDTDIDQEFTAALVRHTGFLRRHLEYDVGGNHLIKGLKAVAGLAVFFADEPMLRRTLRRLAAQLAIQVLADGGHCERAPTYHCQVLADLAGLLGADDRPVPDELTLAILRMRRWLSTVLGPDGRVPLRGDGYPVPWELVAALGPVPPGTGPLRLLPDTGLARLTGHGWHVLACVGAPGEQRLAAHAHADSLSCMAWLDGHPVLADTGTSGYQPGPVRDWERSTAAHSTAVIDGADSTEVWGGFRASHRARVRGLSARATQAEVTCAASHDGYRFRPGRPVHHRRWTVSADGLQIDDTIIRRGRPAVTIGWHLAPGTDVRLRSSAAVVNGPPGQLSVTVHANGSSALSVSARPVAVGFGATTDVPVLECRADGELPLRVTTIWRRCRP